MLALALAAPFALIALLWLALLAGGRIAMRDASIRLDPPPHDTDGGAALANDEIDVIVPARNEEHSLPGLLDSLLAQDLAPRAILVVDDRSEDRTGDVIARFGVRDGRVHSVSSGGPPRGWLGKPAALVRGVGASQAPWLLFVDADVRLAPGNLRAALAEAKRRGWEGISLWGRWTVPSFGARLLQSAVGGFVRGMHPVDRVNDPARPEAFVCGQYLLIRRDAYERLGGWDSVKDQVLEDVAFARHAKKAGGKIGLLLAPELVEVVPYRSLAEAWRGYRKNFVAGAGGPGMALAAAAAVFVGSVLPWIVVIATEARGPVGIAAAAACGAQLLFRLGTARLFHHPRLDALLAPVANLFFVGMVLDAVARRVTGRGDVWKGRKV